MLSGRLERYPGAEVILVHGGGFLPYQLGRLQHGWEQFGGAFGATNGTAPNQLAQKFYFDTVLHDADAIAHLIRTVGADRVVVGTDYPFGMGESQPLELLRSVPGLDAETFAAIVSRNPAHTNE